MQRHKILFSLIVCLVLGSSYLFTSEANAMKNITAKELKQLIDSGIPLFLLNPLSEIEFNEAHINGSVNIPIEEIYDTKGLPEDKSTMIVTYCNGPKCVLSKQAAGLVANRYYNNVATFKGGLPAWKKAGYPLNKNRALPKHNVPKINGNQFKKLVGSACILDIRTPKLYGELKLKRRFGPNADNLSLEYKKKYFVKIPLSRLTKQYKKIPNDRKIVVMDHRGKQSHVAARFLLSNGFSDVCVIKGGIFAVSE